MAPGLTLPTRLECEAQILLTLTVLGASRLCSCSPAEPRPLLRDRGRPRSSVQLRPCMLARRLQGAGLTAYVPWGVRRWFLLQRA